MFEAFYWMFKQPEFKRHFRYLFFIYIVFIAVAAACLGIGELFFKGDVLISLIILLIFFLLIISQRKCSYNAIFLLYQTSSASIDKRLHIM